MTSKGERISAGEFSGHRGFVVDDAAGEVAGELDARDTARLLVRDDGVRGRMDAPGDALGPDVEWDNPAYAAARDDFVKTRTLLREVRAQLTTVSAALKVPGGSRPVETRLTTPLAQAAAVFESAASPALRTDAGNLVSWGEVLMAGHYTLWINLPGRISRGKRAYEVQREATRLDPTNDEAWYNYGLFVLGVFLSPYRDLAGVHFPQEFDAAAAGLARFPKDARAQAVLDALLAIARRHKVEIRGAERLHLEVQQRLPSLRREQPEDAAEADALLVRIRKAIDEAPPST